MDVVERIVDGFQQGQMPDIGTWKYMLLALMVMLQGRPSAVLSGIAAAAGYLNLWIVILVAVLARVMVDFIWYRVGATGRAERFSGRLATWAPVFGQAREKLQERPRRVFLMSKFVGGLALPTVVVAGSARVPFSQLLPASFAGELVWTLPFLLFGYFASDAASHFGGLPYLTLGFSAIMLLGLLVRPLRRRIRGG